MPQWYEPQWSKCYQCDASKFSSFSRMILYENNDDIYDNPAIQAVINFRWKKARNFIFFHFLRFLIFISCFGLVCWAYFFDHSTIRNEKGLVAAIVIFYYMAIYLLITELSQLYYRGLRKYFKS